MTSLRNKIAQMLIIGFPESALTLDTPISEWLQSDGLGGVILFDFNMHTRSFEKNLKTREQIKKLNQQLNALNASDLPLFISIDYEGGHVDRLKHVDGCRQTLSPYEQSNLSESELKIEIELMADTLADLGFNLNFSPVLDLNLNDVEGIIGKLGRSFSQSPQRVIALATECVRGFNARGIVCCYKHFPGHGSATGDTHQGFVDVSESYQSAELEPYIQLVKNTQQRSMIMTAHVINRQLDPGGLPATLSHTVLTGLLRDELGFDGVIISDDLQMHAIAHHYTLQEALCLTINAGADMVIFGNQLGNHTAPELIDCIEHLVQANKIPMARIEEAFQRIVKIKV
jgi:beta-N-acetylhexosaminidase